MWSTGTAESLGTITGKYSVSQESIYEGYDVATVGYFIELDSHTFQVGENLYRWIAIGNEAVVTHYPRDQGQGTVVEVKKKLQGLLR